MGEAAENLGPPASPCSSKHLEEGDGQGLASSGLSPTQVGSLLPALMPIALHQQWET